MSEQTEPEYIELPRSGDAAFGALMDALAPEEGAGAAGGETPGAAAGGADPAAAGGAAADGGGDGQAGQQAAGADPDAGAAGGAEGAADPGAGRAEGAAAGDAADAAAAGGDGGRPADWTASAADFGPKLGELSVKLEENTTKAYRSAAFEEVREEHPQYFEALNKHPRLLVGTQVPAIGKEGMETLRDTNDAREWQEAVKSLLVDEVNDRASRALDENVDFLETVHSSIELFQNNPDLVPGTKDFDVELANRFAQFAEPYELRVDGKLQGYSVPVQPLIDRIRDQVHADRAAKPPAPAAPAAPAKPPADPPQAGIPSKAGNSAEAESFSTLFGTIGLPNLQI